MSVELTTDQARVADALRRRWPNGRVVSHAREWGVILEVRVGDHAVDLVALTADGGVKADADLRHAA
jgi:hypothetical protein